MSLQGAIRVPSDKSISHRAVLFSALASGTSNLSNLLPSDDVLSSLGAVEQLGAKVITTTGERGLDAQITGFAGKPVCDKQLEIDCGNSGTTTRLLMGLICGLGVTAKLYGDSSLSTRPMRRVIDPLSAMGASIESATGTLPALVKPAQSPLKPISYNSPKASAQVKSAVLLAGLQAQGTTSVTEPAKSRDHTELLLSAFGVDVSVDGLTASVTGPAQLVAHDMSVPADPSSAAFVAVAASVMEASEVCIKSVLLNPTRTGAFEVLKRMGAQIVYNNVGKIGAELVGDVMASYSPNLKAVTVTPEEIPTLIDEIPVLAIAAAAANGTTVFEGAGELRVKESDRFAAVIDGLAAFGVRAWAQGDDLCIQGCGCSLYALADACDDEPVELCAHSDHRLAMTWYLMGLACEAPVRLDDAACVSVSWPSFYEDIEALFA